MLATVKGDVHDIGKNLVDIILTNNGYTVVNLGIKQPVNAILEAAEEHDADVIGMSGLLVKSTVIMKENLEELNSRGRRRALAGDARRAALTRAYVEQDLAELFDGEVRYARDAFEGLRLMDAVDGRQATRRPACAEALPDAARAAGRGPGRPADDAARPGTARSDVAVDNPVPTPPFWGDRVVKGIAAGRLRRLPRRAGDVHGPVGPEGRRAATGRRTTSWSRARAGRGCGPGWTGSRPRGMMEPAVVYGYWPCYSEGNDVVVLRRRGPQPARARAVHFPAPAARPVPVPRRLLPAEGATGELDVIAFHLVTMGRAGRRGDGELFAANAYRDYLELHGLSVQLTEALAEYWHARVREELGFAGEDADDMGAMFRQGYRGSRYSFGYPACPDLEDRATLVGCSSRSASA